MTIRGEMFVSRKTHSAVLIAVISLGIILCERVFTYQDVAYGIILALFLALVIYLVIPVIKIGQPVTDCGESLVLIPIYTTHLFSTLVLPKPGTLSL